MSKSLTISLLFMFLGRIMYYWHISLAFKALEEQVSFPELFEPFVLLNVIIMMSYLVFSKRVIKIFSSNFFGLLILKEFNIKKFNGNIFLPLIIT